MPAPVRLGVIGAGRWGRICLRTLSGITAADLVAVASGNPETATLVPPGCRIFADWRELIGSAGVEGLVGPVGAKVAGSSRAVRVSFRVFAVVVGAGGIRGRSVLRRWPTNQPQDPRQTMPQQWLAARAHQIP